MMQKIIQFNRNMILILVLGFIFTYLLNHLANNISLGGNNFSQGDWLINSHAGLTRRFMIGDILLYLSDFFDIGLLKLLGFFQGCILFFLFFNLYILKDLIPGWLFWIFLTSPAFFPFFWFLDPLGAFRKEIIIYLAIFAQILAFKRSSIYIYVFSLLLALIAFLSHEALVLFSPIIILINYLYYDGVFRSEVKAVYSVLIAVFALIGVCFGLLFSNSVVSSDLCAVLMQRNLSPQICSGAIAWLNYPSSYGFSDWDIFKIIEKSISQILSYIIFISPLFFVMMRAGSPWIEIRWLLLLGLPFLPLYFVAVDWGRWLNFHVFSIYIIILVLFQTKRLHFTEMISKKVVLAVISFQLLIASPGHGGTFKVFQLIKIVLEDLVGIEI